VSEPAGRRGPGVCPPGPGGGGGAVPALPLPSGLSPRTPQLRRRNAGWWGPRAACSSSWTRPAH